MNRKIVRILLVVICLGFLALGAVYLWISIFGENATDRTMPLALGFIGIADIFYVVLIKYKVDHEE